MTAHAQLGIEPLGDGRYRASCGGSCGGDAGAHLVTIGAAIAICDCPAYVLGRRTCKHLKTVLDHLVLAPLEAATSTGPGLLDRDVPLPECDVDA